jgi:hypothetical protein
MNKANNPGIITLFARSIPRASPAAEIATAAARNRKCHRASVRGAASSAWNRLSTPDASAPISPPVAKLAM